MLYERPVNHEPFITHYNRKLLIAALREENSVTEVYDVVTNGPKHYFALYNHKIPAGFPDATADHRRELIDLTEYLIDQPDATFPIRVGGDSMIDAGILPGDIAIVDRSLTAKFGDSVVAVIYGEFTIKTLCRGPGEYPILRPANSTGKHKPIYVKEGMDFEIWGVVIGTVRKFKR